MAIFFFLCEDHSFAFLAALKLTAPSSEWAMFRDKHFIPERTKKNKPHHTMRLVLLQFNFNGLHDLGTTGGAMRPPPVADKGS